MLTLEEIENISFRKAGIGGYKTEDVDTFVDGVILKVKDLENTGRELENRIEQLNAQIQIFRERQESVQDAIITAEITAKSIVREATHKAEIMITDANTKSENIIKEATEKSENMLAESNTKADTILNNATRKSAEKVDENNHILENQKKLITQIQNEVSRFKDALIQSYRNHLEIINSLPKADEFKAYQKKLDEYYPTAEVPNSENKEQPKQDIKKAEPKSEVQKKIPVMEVTKAENENKNKKEDVFSSSENKDVLHLSKKPVEKDKIKDNEAEDVPAEIKSDNKREPVIINNGEDDKKNPTKFGVLKLDDTLDNDSKK